MDKIKTAFVTFFPIKPDSMGSSAVVNSRYNCWPYKKKAFQISHIQKINNRNIETIFIKKENPINKILKLPEMIFRTLRFLKKAKKKFLLLKAQVGYFIVFLSYSFLKFLDQIPKLYIYLIL